MIIVSFSPPQTGDMVLATDVSLEVKGVPEFATIDASQAVFVPTGVDPVKASACGDAAIALAMVNGVVIGDRVLIIGGGNTSCGASSTQLARLAGASYIAITTGSLIHPIKSATKVDDVISEDSGWVEDPKYLENKFDKIICTRESSDPSKTNKILKSNSDGGKLIHLRSFTQVALNRKKEGLSRVLQLLKDDKLKIILDPSSPLSFSEEGVEMAYELYTSENCRGRVVIQVT
jgi:NADPH:quinone reductase-like Zn-dependent oxidoreductase